ncbi:MAG: beta-propeller domain-containing protein [Promethearchaeota archaeon]
MPHIRTRFGSNWLRQVRSQPVKVVLLLSTIIGGFAIAGLYLDFQLNSPVQLQRFRSQAELALYVQNHHPPQGYGWGLWLEDINLFTSGDTPSGLQGTSGYSTTNVQVEGVDEPDIVKTDGTYIYTITEEKVAVVKAYPVAMANIVNWIYPEGTPLALFLWDTSRLAVISRVTHHGDPWSPDTISLQVYDVSQPSSITLLQRIDLENYYVSARLIGKYLYLIVQDWISEENGTVELPSITIGNSTHIIPAETIYYDLYTYDYRFCYYHILAQDISNPDNPPTSETFLGGTGTCTIYASLVNLYLAISHFDFSTNAISHHSTAIHRFAICEGQVLYEASGKVPGLLINQFALDEHEGYLRVATTRRIANFTSTPMLFVTSWTQDSNLYILNAQLDTVGLLEGLAPGESIYSVRFLESVCYLVTFWKTDPLFIIDLSDPTTPHLQGELIIPGYSNYLHPLGDNQLVGIGKEVQVSEAEDWWWYEGLKLSLFNATDPYTPKENAKLILGVRGTDSPALNDHHAVLYHPDQQLLIIPVLLAEYTDNYTHEPFEHGDYVWQGAYIFYLNPATATLTIRHQITHLADPDVLHDDIYKWQSHFITRSLYINEVLYTLSPSTLRFHNLTDFTPLGEILFNETSPTPTFKA